MPAVIDPVFGSGGVLLASKRFSTGVPSVIEPLGLGVVFKGGLGAAETTSFGLLLELYCVGDSRSGCL